MRRAIARLRPALWTGLLLVGVAASSLASFAIVRGLRDAGLLPDPTSDEAAKVIRELGIRLTLALTLGAVYLAILSRESLRGWVLARPWRLQLLVLFALGAVTALGDPFHPVASKANWIHYWTAGALLAAGLLAVGSALRPGHPRADRRFGAALGCLTIATGGGEILRLHARAAPGLLSGAPSPGVASPGDLPGLLIGLAGLGLLVGVVAIRRRDGPLGARLRQPRLRQPLRLVALSTLAFLAARLLDSFDASLQRGLDRILAAHLGDAAATRDPLWSALTDASQLANSIEELLELLAALALLMLVGCLFRIGSLGAEGATESS